MSEEPVEKALWNPLPHELHPADSWYRRCPDCGLIVQWGAHGLAFHWEVVHPGREELVDWDIGLIPGNIVSLPVAAQLSLVPEVPPQRAPGAPSPPASHARGNEPTNRPSSPQAPVRRPRNPPPQEDTLF